MSKQFEDGTRWPEVREYIKVKLEQQRSQLEGVSTLESLHKAQARLEAFKSILNNEKTATEG